MAHLPRSILRQRSLQKGKSSSLKRTSMPQVGQRRSFADFFFAGMNVFLPWGNSPYLWYSGSERLAAALDTPVGWSHSRGVCNRVRCKTKQYAGPDQLRAGSRGADWDLAGDLRRAAGCAGRIADLDWTEWRGRRAAGAGRYAGVVVVRGWPGDGVCGFLLYYRWGGADYQRFFTGMLLSRRAGGDCVPDSQAGMVWALQVDRVCVPVERDQTTDALHAQYQSDPGFTRAAGAFVRGQACDRAAVLFQDEREEAAGTAFDDSGFGGEIGHG